jgi:hypothetical protein
MNCQAHAYNLSLLVAAAKLSPFPIPHNDHFIDLALFNNTTSTLLPPRFSMNILLILAFIATFFQTIFATPTPFRNRFLAHLDPNANLGARAPLPLPVAHIEGPIGRLAQARLSRQGKGVSEPKHVGPQALNL